MYDLIIIGAGPAGLSAGLYAGRYRLKTLILEKMSIGGQIILTPTIENFPGFPESIATEELVDRFKKQVDDLGVNIEMQEVLEISQDLKSGVPIYDIVTKEKSYAARSIIIATGAKPARLGVKGEEQLTGRGVSYCGTCDGPLFRDKEIVVVGAGDRAIEEAIFLSGYAKSVTIIHRRAMLRASRILEDKARSNPKINFVLENVIDEIVGKDKVEAVKIRNVKTNLVNQLSCKGVFIFVGIEPNTDFLKNLLALNNAGFIVTGQDLMTSKKGIFAAGDCREKSLYQVITACSDGAMACAGSHKYIL